MCLNVEKMNDNNEKSVHGGMSVLAMNQNIDIKKLIV